MTTAFVLTGGGSLGAVQAGMLQALADHGIEPDLLVGASAGALNAAFVAGHGFRRDALEQLADVWRGLRRRDVFPFSPHRHVMALAGTRPSLCATEPLRRLVEAHVRFRVIEDAQVPLHVVATDVLAGTDVVLSEGEPVGAVLASAAIPGVFPTVMIGGRTLFDGGVANNAPVSHAVALGATKVVVLPAGTSCALRHPPRTALATAVHALTLLVQQRLALDVAAYAGRVELVILPPLCPLSVPSVDFRSGALLVERARAASRQWLESGNHLLPRPERFLALHDHPQLRSSSASTASTCSAMSATASSCRGVS